MAKNTQKNIKKCKFLRKFRNFVVISPKNTFIERGAEIGKSTIVYPNCHIDSNTKIGDCCTILPGCVIENSVIGNGAQIGPYAHLRAGTQVGDNVRLGNFCETKNSYIGSGTKIAHLTYVGDAEIGENCNLGCGVVFANYNGVVKQHITVGKNCFIGCNVNLVAPLKLGDNVFIAAGTTVTKNIPKNTFAIARPELELRENLAFNKIHKK